MYEEEGTVNVPGREMQSGHVEAEQRDLWLDWTRSCSPLCERREDRARVREGAPNDLWQLERDSSLKEKKT